MRIPFRALHVFPSQVCLSPSCLKDVLNDPLVSVVPVSDDIDINYAFDLQITQGFYLLLISYYVLSYLRKKIVETFR